MPSTREPPRVCAVVAAYNEAGKITALAQKLRGVLDQMELPSRYVFVVQGTDGTRGEIETIQRHHDDVQMYYSPTPMGVGPAYRQGFAMVADSDDLIVMIDGDGEHDPAYIVKFYEAMQQQGADLVIGSRYIGPGRAEGSPLWKRIASKVMNRTVSILFRISAVDKTGGYRFMRADLGRKVAALTQGRGFDFYLEFLVRAAQGGARIIEVPIVYRFNDEGGSKMYKFDTAVNYMRLFWRLMFRRRPS